MADIEHLQALIRQAIPAFAAPAATDDSVLQFLLDQGTEPLLARQVVAFAPLAFGRAVLARLPVTLSTTYSLLDEQNDLSEGHLLELEEVFLVAQWLAEECIEQQQWREDQHLRLAMWSAEFKAVNDLLHAGSQAKNIEVAPPVLLWEVASAMPPRAVRPWWKFW